MKTKYTFSMFREEEYFFRSPDPALIPQEEISICVHGDASTEDMLDAFARFLRACGYFVPTEGLEFAAEEVEDCNVEEKQEPISL